MERHSRLHPDPVFPPSLRLGKFEMSSASENEPSGGSAPLTLPNAKRWLPARAEIRELAPAPIVVSPVAEPQVALNVLHYWNILVKWLWLIGGLAALGVAGGVATTLLTTPIYRATTTIQIDMEPAKVQAIQSPARVRHRRRRQVLSNAIRTAEEPHAGRTGGPERQPGR